MVDFGHLLYMSDAFGNPTNELEKQFLDNGDGTSARFLTYEDLLYFELIKQESCPGESV